MTDMISEESREIEYIYPLERIALIASKLSEHIVPLLNGFREFYDSLEVKPIDVSTFKKNFGRFANQNKNRYQQNAWKRKNRFRGKDIEKYLANAYVKQLPQNDLEKIRKTIISHLNKLNDKKFTIIVKEFIDSLEEQMFFETYQILNSEIINKVYTDNQYVYLYARLVKELIINKKWQRKMFHIINNDGDEKHFYWSLNKLEHTIDDAEFVGPFDSEAEALDDAMDHHNYNVSFSGFMEQHFNNRGEYQLEIENNRDDFDLTIYTKNKYNNFLKLIFYCVEHGVYDIKLVHHCLLKLLESFEIEQFGYLYEVIHGTKFRFKADNHRFYESKLNEVLQKTTISPKTKFKLQEFFSLQLKRTNAFEALTVLSSDEGSINSPREKSMKNNDDVNIDCIVSEYPLNNDYQLVVDLFKTLSDEKYEDFTVKVLVGSFEAKEDESRLLISLVKRLWNDFEDFKNNFENFVVNRLVHLYADYEIDYPNSKVILVELLKDWVNVCGKRNMIDQLRSMETDDEDKQYSIELFNENVVSML